MNLKNVKSKTTSGGRGRGRPKLYDNALKVLMTDRQRDALEAEAAELGIPAAQVLRDLINENLLEVAE